MNEETNETTNLETVPVQDPVAVSQESITVPLPQPAGPDTYSARSSASTPMEASGTPDSDPLGLNDGRYSASEIAEQPQIIKVEGEKKPGGKKKVILLVLLLLVVAGAVAGAIFFMTRPQNKQSAVQKKVSNDSFFVQTINESLQKGEFVKEINKGLEDAGLTTEKVYLQGLDIDSDGEIEIMVYAEGSDRKTILQLEVDEAVFYDDAFPVDSKESIGYVYSSEKRDNFWYTEYSKNFTIIGSTKKIIKEEDFISNYYVITKKYDDKAIFENAIEYKMDKNLDAKKLEKDAITNEKLLENNKIEASDIQKNYEKYLKEKEEADKKKREEEEEKAKKEEEEKKLAGSLRVGNSSYRFGTYNVYAADGSLDGVLIIYGDSTCVHKGMNCTYQVADVRGANDTLVPGISLSTGQGYVAKADGEFTNADGTISIQYKS